MNLIASRLPILFALQTIGLLWDAQRLKLQVCVICYLDSGSTSFSCHYNFRRKAETAKSNIACDCANDVGGGNSMPLIVQQAVQALESTTTLNNRCWSQCHEAIVFGKSRSAALRLRFQNIQCYSSMKRHSYILEIVSQNSALYL